MELILGIVVCLLIFYIFWFIGHIVRKELNLNEDCELLSHLLNIAFGSVAFLIIVNLTGRILNNFNFALILIFIGIGYLIYKNLEDFKRISLSLKDLFVSNKLFDFAKEKADKNFWIIIGVLNLIYALRAFSSVKIDRFGLGNKHVFNVLQISGGSYPPRYSFFPNLIEQFHYGSDVFGALITKLSMLHPELSLDLLTVVFLNLSFLTMYALTRKYQDSNKLNRYIIPIAAFIAWGPITNLFNTKGESVPNKILDGLFYLSQNKLSDACSWSGSVVHWFFDPPTGFGVFYFLITLYVLFKFIQGERTLKFTILLSVLLSSLIIIDVTKYILIFAGVLIYLACLIFNDYETNKKVSLNDYKAFGILLGGSLLLGVIHGNWINFDTNLVSAIGFYNLGSTNMSKVFDPFKSNFILIALYCFGFYEAFKNKDKWNTFLIPFFASGLLLPYTLSIPNAGVGKFVMSSNILGVFTIPFLMTFIEGKLKSEFKFDEKKIRISFIVLAVIFSSSSVMFWAFGDKDKPLFNSLLKFQGFQTIPAVSQQLEEYKFLKHLRLSDIANKVIISESPLAEVFPANVGLFHFLAIGESNQEPIKNDVIDGRTERFLTSFSFDSDYWSKNNIHWLYVTPGLFKFLTPQSKSLLLNSYLNNGTKLSLSNHKGSESNGLKELYEINPGSLKSDSKDYKKKLKEFLGKKKDDKFPYFLEQVALSPYSAVYGYKSNDFDGDKIADISFFDQKNRKWIIISGKTQEEKEIDLVDFLPAIDPKKPAFYIPMPADYDGDSKADIALANRVNGLWYIKRSSDSMREPVRAAGIAYGEPFLIGDLDGDGKADPSCYNVTDRRWPTLLSGGSYSYSDMTFGTYPADITIYSDLDGDKKSDHVIYRPEEGLFIAYVSTKSYSPSSAIKVRIGEKTSRAVPADYDGDGKEDFATWTPGSGKWEIAYAKDFLSASNSASPPPPQQFFGCGGAPAAAADTENVNPCAVKTSTVGGPGDIPMPADYNGDGKVDVAIYHSDTSTLEVFIEGSEPKKTNLSKYANLIPAFFVGV